MGFQEKVSLTQLHLLTLPVKKGDKNREFLCDSISFSREEFFMGFARKKGDIK
ncbi:MAG: hypothetical protein L3J44_07535 [Campylobacteraceae bacterium]|nr:hypothetical protein [Campylobacteraceae bacterium]